MLRTHFAGELNAAAIGQTVTLAGWVARRRDHGGVIFVDLRDSSGIAQVVFRKADVAEQAHHLRSEYCIKVTGVVEARPEGSENQNLASGEIEINVSELEVLNSCAPLPFQLDDEPCGTATLICAVISQRTIFDCARKLMQLPARFLLNMTLLRLRHRQ